MDWKYRATGHVVLEEADWSRRTELRNAVGFRVYSRSFGRRTVWLIGTGTSAGGKKWNPGDFPFGEVAPKGSEAFVERVQQLAQPFCAAIDAIAEHNKTLPRNQWPLNPLTRRPSKPEAGRTSRHVGELSLGLEMATLLGVPVFSFISNSDAGDELACVTAPSEVKRILCQRDEMTLAFSAGALSISPTCPTFLARIPGVRSATRARESNGDQHALVIGELNAFAGRGFADPDHVLPGIDELELVGERTGGGKYSANPA